jgi:hypothetical protein
MGDRPRSQQRFRPVYRVLHALFPATALWPRLIAYGHMRQMRSFPPGPARQREANLALKWLGLTERLATKKRKQPLPEVWQVSGLTAWAEAAFYAGDLDAAEAYATELFRMPDLARAARMPGSSDVGVDEAHIAHIVLGKVALSRGDIDEAERRLLLAVQHSPRSGAFTTFGPDMELAQGVLASGRRESVLSYLRACRRFWHMGADQVETWISEIGRGEEPDFSVRRYNLFLSRRRRRR